VCAACGALLALADEPPPRRLDATLPIDRRGPARPASGSAAPSLPPTPASEPSRWELGSAPVARSPEPAVGRLDHDLVPDLGPYPDRDLGPDRDADLDHDPRLDPDIDVDAVEIHLAYAPAWRRALAWLVDAVPFAALAAALARAALPREPPPRTLDALLDLLVRERAVVVPIAAFLGLAAVVYATLGHALGGATLGKRLAGLRVVARDGRPPGWRRSAARALLALASAAFLGLGFLLALFTRSGRALHDLLAGTFVVATPRGRPVPEGDGPSETY